MNDAVMTSEQITTSTMMSRCLIPGTYLYFLGTVTASTGEFIQYYVRILTCGTLCMYCM